MAKHGRVGASIAVPVGDYLGVVASDTKGLASKRACRALEDKKRGAARFAPDSNVGQSVTVKICRRDLVRRKAKLQNRRRERGRLEPPFACGGTKDSDIGLS